MYYALLVIFLLVAISLVALIILQKGKGADMVASFGAAASSTLFSSSRIGNFMTRMTAVLATFFFFLSLLLGNLNNNNPKKNNSWDTLTKTQQADGCSVKKNVIDTR
ncbi:preprotein translocase subunit SecG [secondary endosymbiont of Ctenarytaina eucalypti]|uniref:Protein-export membrane protein SecG n=1 Tax=secondary endosymbiont of Ctenarytaina eucalypti TaxID=1199245 RepID=J3VSI7_9ENTR|nr:preprotein translocase subunit SecG [secondary endosymbiont of Ctenarytaina eucalypti]AFP84886.1 protein translocase, SecG subunit [secondary endosymbiont of Ctenarytaina eucalypti]